MARQAVIEARRDEMSMAPPTGTVVRLYGAWCMVGGVEYGKAMRIPLDATDQDRDQAAILLNADLRSAGLTDTDLTFVEFKELVRYATPGDMKLPELSR